MPCLNSIIYPTTFARINHIPIFIHFNVKNTAIIAILLHHIHHMPTSQNTKRSSGKDMWKGTFMRRFYSKSWKFFELFELRDCCKSNYFLRFESSLNSGDTSVCNLCSLLNLAKGYLWYRCFSDVHCNN